jgi:peptide subunit release factor 1 (eRF1)
MSPEPDRCCRAFSGLRGDGTTMVSMYMRGGHQDDLVWARTHVRREIGTAGNIKTPKTARLVRAALETALELLRSVSVVPPGGLALFAGQACGGRGGVGGDCGGRAGRGGERGSERVAELVVGDRPIERKGYVCAQEFDLEQLASSLRTASGPRVGVVVVDGGGAVGVVLQGDTVEPGFRRSMGRWSSGSRRGGQSALRFARLRAEQEHNYLTLVVEQLTGAWTSDGLPNVDALVLAGPGDKKDELRDRLPRALRELVRAVVTTAQGGEEGLITARAEATLAIASAAVGREARAVDEIYTALELTEDLVAYTPAAVLRATARGQAERVVAWAELEGLVELRDLCAATGTAIELVSDRSEAGARLVREFGGAAAMLRWV